MLIPLDALPDRAGSQAQLTAWFAQDSPGYGWLSLRPGGLFALEFHPPKQQRLLVTMTSANEPGSEKVVVDPNNSHPRGRSRWIGRSAARQDRSRPNINGALNVTEFGTVKVPAQFNALYAYSPYHRVIDGTKYPAVFFLAGENDQLGVNSTPVR